MKFDLCMQEPQAEAVLETVIEEERKVFMDMLW